MQEVWGVLNMGRDFILEYSDPYVAMMEVLVTA